MEKTLRLLRAVREAGAREGSFWAALSPGEQADIVSAARKRTFPHGAVLMRQSDRAGHVMVILDGQAKVSVSGPGQERVIAARDPGDLIGEAVSASSGDHVAIEALRDVAARKLPQLNELIERSQIVRGWLEAAARCECPSLEECPLFEDPALLPAQAGRPRTDDSPFPASS